MATHRLPIPGKDNGSWGDILNDFLVQAHNTDGSLQDGIITDAKVASSAAISKTKLAAGVQASLATADTSVQSVNTKIPTSGAVTLVAADVGAPLKPAAGADSKVLKWNNTSGQLEDATALLTSTYNSAASGVQTITIVGDSISANSGIRDTGTLTNNQTWGVKGWAPIADALTGHRCRWIIPGATGPGSLADPNTALHSSAPSGIGFCLGGMFASELLTYGYMDAAVASAANIIVVHAGTNDINASVDGTSVANSLLALWRIGTAAGKRVIATTILPRDSTVITGAKLTAMTLANKLIRQYAASEPNVFLCDWHASMLDASAAAPGSGASAWSLDGLHPNAAGAWRMGTVLAVTLAGMLAPGLPQDHLLIDPTEVLTPNPYATGGTTTATSWTITNVGSPASVTPTKVARTDLVPGAWQQIVCAAATANTDGYNMTVTDSTTSSWATGDTVYAFAEIQVDAADWDCRGLQLDVVKSGVTTVASANNIASSERTALTTALGPAPTGGLIFVTPRIQLDASLTAVRAVLRFYGSGTIRVGRMGVIKV